MASFYIFTGLIVFPIVFIIQSVQLDLDMRGERLASLTKEIEELTSDGRSDIDLAALRRSKNELELKVKDQEEELDELAGQVQMLESARLRLEMSMEQMRKENKKEISQRDEEMEDIRCSAQKKVKGNPLFQEGHTNMKHYHNEFIKN